MGLMTLCCKLDLTLTTNVALGTSLTTGRVGPARYLVKYRYVAFFTWRAVSTAVGC